MSKTSVSRTPKYAWYQVGKLNGLEQGDLLPQCLVPTVYFPKNLKPILKAKEDYEVELKSTLTKSDLIIMTQSCDLAADKVKQIILCEYFPASSQTRNIREEVRKDRRPPLHLIEKCELPVLSFERQIVDFRVIHVLPKDFVIGFAKTLKVRARLLSPYKEHLSQAFARYFMRVGLPRPLSED